MMDVGMIGGLRSLVGKTAILQESRGTSIGGPKSDVTLEVLEGFHAGARLNLSELAYAIGSGIEADIVLSDPGVEPAHMRLRNKRGEIELEAVGGPVRLAGGAVLPKDHGCICQLPLEIAVGSAKLLIQGPDQSPQHRHPRKPVLVAAGFVIAALFVVASGLSLAHSGREASRASAQTLVSDIATGKSDVLAKGAMHASQEPEAQLRGKLAEAHLDSVTIKRVQDRVVVSGTIPDHQSEAWTKIQSWFDQTYGDRILLATDLKANGLDPAPRVNLQAIWYGDRPYIITADGARYYEGGFLRGGWAITRIDEKQLLLTKGSSTVTFTYP